MLPTFPPADTVVGHDTRNCLRRDRPARPCLSDTEAPMEPSTLRPYNAPGRPPIGPRLEVRLPAAVVDELDAYASRAGVTRAELIRSILEQWAAEL